MAASDPLDPTVIDWFFRGLAAISPFLALVGGYILRLNSNRLTSIEERQGYVEGLAQDNRLAIKEAEILVANLRTHITENFCNKVDIQQSLARVHEKIEDGNKKTDEINTSVGNKIDQLRRDLQADIRSAISVALHQTAPSVNQ
jgi:hypothetical protein